jgi:serine/threonine protein kinase
MDYTIQKAKFEILNNNKILDIHINDTIISYNIINYLGKGMTGYVYLLDKIEPEPSENKLCVIKISNPYNDEDLLYEISTVRYYFKKYNIMHKSYPKYYGLIKNSKNIGIIYPYFGYYNIETIKTFNINITYNYNISIIKQIIHQLKQLKKVIHCDLKPANIVIDIDDNTINATIIDFGLMVKRSTFKNILSTSYITSPESLLTLEEYKDCVVDDSLNCKKHDYYGLFSNIITLFSKTNFWNIISRYVEKNLNIEYKFLLTNQRASDLFVYCWYKFFYNNINDIEIVSLKNLIEKIESNFPNIKNKSIFSYSDFFDNIIKNDLNTELIDPSKIELLKDFIEKLIHFNYQKRWKLRALLKHPFLTLN